MKTAKSKDYAMGIRRVRVGDAIRKENKNGSRKKIWDTRKRWNPNAERRSTA